jgi:uncharacterized protein (TIGR00255 family)
MTGYGDARVATERFVFSVEVRCVNNRFLKVHFKVPDEVLYLQNDMEVVIRSRLSRGSVFVTVLFEPARQTDLYDIDGDVLNKYLERISRIKAQFQLRDDLKAHVQDPVQLRDLLPLPGVVRAVETLALDKQHVWPAAQRGIEEALVKVSGMRETEGRHLERELRQRAQSVGALLDSVRRNLPQAMEEYHRRLDRKVRQLLGDQQAVLAPEDVLKELAILAERSDISEEISRMESHLKQFTRALDSAEPVGRKLEFLVQEMYRESNTMGAKTISAGVSQDMVEMKAEVDRLKEHVLNIE